MVGSKNPNAIPEVTVTAPIEKYTASDIIETLKQDFCRLAEKKMDTASTVAREKPRQVRIL